MAEFRRDVLLIIMLFGLWQSGKVYAEDLSKLKVSTTDSAVPIIKEKDVDKDSIIAYLKILNQKSATSAQLEASMSAQQKQILDALSKVQQELQSQVGKMNESCGKGFKFSEAKINCQADKQ